MGFGAGSHGITPSPTFVANCMYLYKKFGYSCPIVAEVVEEDYTVCDNYKKTVNLLRKTVVY